MPYIVPFEDYTPELRPLVGGKNASLGEMMAAGLPVPPGFALTTEAYDTLWRRPGLREEVDALLAKVDASDPAAVEPISAAIRQRIEAAPVDPAVAEAVAGAYDLLCRNCAADALPVAVRSSASAEDLPDASFAGEHDSFMWVRGPDDVLASVVRCWSSLYTARAICYRIQTGHDSEALRMSVGVQKMVVPKAAGVAFTLNPSDGDRSQIAIDASWGLGEAVVAGEVTPDNFLVDKVIFEVSRRTISPKTVEYRINADGVERVEIEGERCTSCCLTEDEIKAVARMARRAERHYGCPQDIEWAVDAQLPAPDNVVLLQSRPETVWSRQARPPVATPGTSVLEGIVSTLCSPIYTRPKSVVRTQEEAG